MRMYLPVPAQFTGSCAVMLFLFPNSITQPPPHTAVTLRLSHHGHAGLSLLCYMSKYSLWRSCYYGNVRGITLNRMKEVKLEREA